MRGQDLLELDQGPQSGLLDAGHRGTSGSGEADGYRDRLLVVEYQRRHRGAGAKAVTAGWAAQRLHGITQLTQALHVSPDRPSRHPEAAGQLVSWPVAAGLK